MRRIAMSSVCSVGKFGRSPAGAAEVSGPAGPREAHDVCSGVELTALCALCCVPFRVLISLDPGRWLQIRGRAVDSVMSTVALEHGQQAAVLGASLALQSTEQLEKTVYGWVVMVMVIRG